MKSLVMILSAALLPYSLQPAFAFELSATPLAGAGASGQAAGADTLDLHAPSHPWRASLEYTRSTLSPAHPHAQAWAAGVARRFSWGSLGAQLVRADRFGLRDEAVVLDSYLRLWPGAYTNLRVQAAREAEVLPSTDAGLDLYQAGPHGLEIAAGYRRQVYATAPVDVYSAAVGSYLADWYFRGRITVASVGGETAAAYGAGARRYLGSTDSFAEITAGVGGEVVDLIAAPPAGLVVDLRPTRFAAVHTRAFFSSTLGASATLSVNHYEQLSTRRGFSLGLLARW